MPIYEPTNNQIRAIDETTFAAAGIIRDNHLSARTTSQVLRHTTSPRPDRAVSTQRGTPPANDCRMFAMHSGAGYTCDSRGGDNIGSAATPFQVAVMLDSGEPRFDKASGYRFVCSEEMS